MTNDNINLVDKVYGIMAERTELGRLIHEFVTENGLEDSFYNHLIMSEDSGEYRQLDIEHMALDYMGGGDEEEEQLTNRDFFFCYSPQLSQYLSNKGHRYIVVGVNPKNQTMYSMYQKSDELSDSINEYRKL